MRKPRPAPAAPLVLAPLWRRSLACVLDVNVIVDAAAEVGAEELLARAALRNDWCRRLLEHLRPQYTALGKPTSGQRVRPERLGVKLGMRVARRNRQTYGEKLMSIRRVDVTDGGPVTLKSAIVHGVIRGPIITLPAARLAARAYDRRLGRATALLALDLAELNQRHADDPVAVARETTKLYASHGLYTPIVLWAAIPIAAHIVCIIVLPKHQSLPELAAGIAFTSVKTPSSAKR